MIDKLRTLENLAELLYQELKIVRDHNSIGDKARPCAREAMLLSINVKRHIQQTRAWHVEEIREKKEEAA